MVGVGVGVGGEGSGEGGEGERKEGERGVRRISRIRVEVYCRLLLSVTRTVGLNPEDEGIGPDTAGQGDRQRWNPGEQKGFGNGGRGKLLCEFGI